MIIAIDSGKQTGYATWINGDLRSAGSVEVNDALQFMSLLQRLYDLSPWGETNKLVYENAAWHPSKATAEAYGWRRGVMCAWASKYWDVTMFSVSPHKIKQAAGVPVRQSQRNHEGTDRQRKRAARRAGKTAMVEAARKRWPVIEFTDDNAADAAWLAYAAEQLFGDNDE